MIRQLEDELGEYDRLKSGEVALPHVERLDQIAPFITRIRIAKGVSQTELARRLGVSKQVISRYEESDYQTVVTHSAPEHTRRDRDQDRCDPQRVNLRWWRRSKRWSRWSVQRRVAPVDERFSPPNSRAAAQLEILQTFESPRVVSSTCLRFMQVLMLVSPISNIGSAHRTPSLIVCLSPGLPRRTARNALWCRGQLAQGHRFAFRLVGPNSR